MKFLTFATGGPSRTPAGTAGNCVRSSFRSLPRLAGLSAAPSKSRTWVETSRMMPWASTMPGFSAPGAPNRTSFMALLLAVESAGGSLSVGRFRVSVKGDCGWLFHAASCQPASGSIRLSRAVPLLRLLNRGAWHGAVGAEDAAVARLRPQPHGADWADVKV